jgi:hypothetical protein
MTQSWRGPYTRYKEFFLNISALYEKRPDVRAFLEIILSLSTVIIFLIFALKPTAITIVDLLQQIKERKETLSALTQKVTDLKTVNTIVQQNQDYISDIDSAIPAIPNPDILSEQIEGLAAKNSIEILGISVNQIPLVGDLTNKSATKYTPLPENVNEMPFSLSLRGGFSNLILFIHDFQNMRIATKIDTLSINSSVSNNGSTVVAVITGRVPYLGK